METYNFTDHITGDTFDGVTFAINVNGSPLDLTGATITASFRRNFYDTKTLTSPTNISITDPDGGEFVIDPLIIDWEPGTYSYDIQINLLSGAVKTYIKGTWNILEDV